MEALSKEKKVMVTHIYHSGVMIETESKLLIIDYFHEKDSFEQQEFLALLKQHSNKDFYYFVTHGHKDHFNRSILTSQFQSLYGTTYYIFSEDLKHHKGAFDTVTLCGPDEDFSVGELNIKTFGSTDQGVSYLIESLSDNTLLFHSGDLNWWHWKSFSNKELEQEKNDFLEEVIKLQEHLKEKNITLDLAFVPVDPRLEEFYHLAGKIFLEEIKPVRLFPLHFRDNYQVTKDFKDQYDEEGHFQHITNPLETFRLADE